MPGKSAQQMVAEARGRIQNLSIEEAAAEVEGRKAVVVDIREAEERSRDGSIPGAIHAPRGMLEFYADPASPYHKQELDPGSRVILHCSLGGRSALAADTLQQMGYSNVAHIEGGFTGWKKAGKPVEGGS